MQGQGQARRGWAGGRAGGVVVVIDVIWGAGLVAGAKADGVVVKIDVVWAK